MNKTAILIIDIINNFQFQEGYLLLNETKKILNPLIELKTYAKRNHIPVIYVNDHYQTWETDFKKICDACLNQQNQEIIDKLAPTSYDYFLIKPQLSGFFRTPLSSLLKELDVTQLIITGIAGNICVLFTANDAHMRGYDLYIPKNCIASNSPHQNKEALKLMEKIFKAKTDPI
ncbi:isochorismatase family cysteine hydrolase [Gracilibacillus sp. YIM 98692]|uniref:isochorismatase family cysteine hydrolase n=1 Tax=Gracilibacillus sp. YIM 98692 TaxID=2663532 RepID=UPI0013D42FDE|nr:isochorismatase family cysteine hydrolase [Gracilibacillus sp. YIM 98692]